MDFQQAAIKVEKEKEFEELKRAVARVFDPNNVERFLKRLQSKRVRARDLDAVLAQRVFESLDPDLAKSGNSARQLYQALAVSDQGQFRELYLSRVEEIDPGLRTKYYRIYRYY